MKFQHIKKKQKTSLIVSGGGVKLLQIKDYLKNKIILDEEIFVAKVKNAYLIGPKINKEFDLESFYKRIISSSLFELKNYKKLSSSKAQKLITQYIDDLENNEVFEIFKDGKILRHKIIKVPVGYDEK